jgi:hypothetical protein
VRSGQDYQFSSFLQKSFPALTASWTTSTTSLPMLPSGNESFLDAWNRFTQRERIFVIVNQLNCGVPLVTSDVDACSAGGISYAVAFCWQAESENGTPTRTVFDTNGSPVRLDNHFRYWQAHAGA